MRAAREILDRYHENGGRRWPARYLPDGVDASLGHGCYGAAYRLDNGRVLKVARESDMTSLWIAEACRLGDKAPSYMPRVYGFGLLQSTDRHGKKAHGWWAVMEFITPATERESVEFLYSGSSGCASGNDCLYEVDPDLSLRVVKHLSRLGKRTFDSGIDDHSGNFGYRDDGSIVLFDPTAAQTTKPAMLLAAKRASEKSNRGPRKGRWS